MEPWHFSHGEGGLGGGPWYDVTMLQWSHGILAMESGVGAPYPVPPASLQWSHGILAMES